MSDIRFATKVSTALKGADVVVVVAPKFALDEGYHRIALDAEWAGALDRAIEDTKPGDLGAACSTYGPEGAPRKIAACVLPDKLSRYNSPTRSEGIFATLPGTGIAGKKATVVVRLDCAEHALGVAVAIARCLPLFDAKSKKDDEGAASKKTSKPVTTIVMTLGDGTIVKADKVVTETVAAVRFASRLVDTPTQEMTTAQMEKEARAAVKGLKGVRVTSIVGDALLKKGLGGIHAVGRTAMVAPRLVVLDHKPARAKGKTVALVGKGIVYDTGGLSLKVGGSMPNMKCDMGGSAAVLGAFVSLVKSGYKGRVVALLCLAENAIGPDSYRPDDIITFHSGKTVEINNTDAEGRLVLADGVSWAARVIKADVIVDAATLTGAALIATGHAVSVAISNRGGLESLAVECGRATGDLTHPLMFAPEFYHAEFKSKVADMRNSVSDRMNAQTSAAGQFIYNHIEDLNPAWLHLDIAGPAWRNGRGTGHGTALIAELVRRLGDEHVEA